MIKILTKNIAIPACSIILGIIAFSAILGPWIAPNDPNLVTISDKLHPPCGKYPLGTDHLGRCILSRLILGARISLGAGLSIMAAILFISIAVGSFSAYAGGYTDAFLMRICDVFLSFPSLILSFTLCGILGPGFTIVVISISLSHWAWYARIIRGMVLGLKDREFVQAARIAGSGRLAIVFRHILPSVLPQVAILITLDFGHFILHVAGLSFLGLGIRPPSPEWGAMINDARGFFRVYPMVMFWPGLMIFTTTMALNILGDALRDLLDPSIERQLAE